MNNGAQASLEYVMTYGWALVLIISVISVLVFIVSSPASDVTFSSSDPTNLAQGRAGIWFDCRN